MYLKNGQGVVRNARSASILQWKNISAENIKILIEHLVDKMRMSCILVFALKVQIFSASTLMILILILYIILGCPKIVHELYPVCEGKYTIKQFVTIVTVLFSFSI